MDDNEHCVYGYSKKGERFEVAENGHRKERISMIAGLCNQHLQAPFMFKGHCNRKTFEAYVEKILVLTLKPGQVVILDNASFHKSKKVESLIAAAGCTLTYLPPYSPDLNPIEHYWHSLKTKIKKNMRDFKHDLDTAMEFVLREVATC